MWQNAPLWLRKTLFPLRLPLRGSVGEHRRASSAGIGEHQRISMTVGGHQRPISGPSAVHQRGRPGPVRSGPVDRGPAACRLGAGLPGSRVPLSQRARGNDRRPHTHKTRAPLRPLGVGPWPSRGLPCRAGAQPTACPHLTVGRGMPSSNCTSFYCALVYQCASPTGNADRPETTGGSVVTELFARRVAGRSAGAAGAAGCCWWKAARCGAVRCGTMPGA